MSDQTSSMNRVKQEEEEAGAALQAGREHVPLPRRPTTLLSLPDDLLLSVYEELYEDQYGDKSISPPISEILVSKRLFNLVRPVWISRLSLGKSQLDQRIAGLLRDVARGPLLQRLDLSLDDAYAQITKFPLSALPRLAHLSLRYNGGDKPKVLQALLEHLSSPSTVEHVMVRADDCDSREATLFAFQIGVVLLQLNCSKSFSYYFSDYLVCAIGGPDRYYRGPLSLQKVMKGLAWWKYRVSEVIQLEEGDRRLQDLVRDLTSDYESTSLKHEAHPKATLRNYSLPVFLSQSIENKTPSPEFDRLLDFLANFEIEDLRFTRLKRLSAVANDRKLASVRILRLSGSSNLQDKIDFTSFFRLLNAFPSLSRLHLVGSSFFGPQTTADSLSKHSNFPLFLFPELATLLLHLRTTQVKVFTFRGLEEKREMRWWRSTNEEDFQKDCWTL